MSAAATKGLGKGLSALMGEEYSQSMNAPKSASSADVREGLHQLPVDAIHSGRFQPRTHFDENYLHELADSIEKNGIMQPIIVRPMPNKAGQFEIIAGERRWRASKLAKLKTIPTIIRDIDDQLALELALVENIQRQDLTALEEAAGYQRLIDEFSYTQDELARTVGKSRSHIANLLRLLSLPDAIKQRLDAGQLTMGHARALLNAPNADALADQIVREDLNVRQAENLVRFGHAERPNTSGGQANSAPQGNDSSSRRQQAPSRRFSGDKDPDIIALEQTLSDNLGLSVSIHDLGNQSGEIVIGYGSLAQLDDILRRLGDSF